MLTRLAFFRPVQPGPAHSAPTRLLLLFAVHIVALSCEVVLVLLLIANLWCLDAGEGASGVRESEILVVGQCSFSSLLLYLTIPPAAAIFPPFVSLIAISLQSPSLLRVASQWRGVALLPTLLSLVLAPTYAQQLGSLVLTIPATLCGLCLLQTQLGMVEVAEMEAARPVRGWRGLIEVRNMTMGALGTLPSLEGGAKGVGSAATTRRRGAFKASK